MATKKNVSSLPRRHQLPNVVTAANSRHPQAGPTWSDVVNAVNTLYPDLLFRTYTVPPVHFNKIPYERRNLFGSDLPAYVIDTPTDDGCPVHDALRINITAQPPLPHCIWTQETETPVRVQENDFRDDFAQNHVMLNLQALGEHRKEAMFILSRFSFGNYLNQPDYDSAAANLPRPSQLNKKKEKYTDGEADLVLIHRQHGVLVGKIKSVGKIKTDGNGKKAIAKRISKAIWQLNRSAKVIKHILSDMPQVPVLKTIFLPYITRHRLSLILAEDSKLQQEMIASLGVHDVFEASQLCCCSDELSNPDSYWNVIGAVLDRLDTWWEVLMKPSVPCQLTDEQYTNLVARFVGPATTVEVHCNIPPRLEVRTRTEGQAVAELGRRFSRLILTPQQLEIMNRNPPHVYITGPPGTGKTLMLVLQGIRWLLHGHPVHIVSTHPGTRIICNITKDQMEKTIREHRKAPPTVTIHYHNFLLDDDDGENIVDKLARAAQNGGVHIIVDEAYFNKGENYSKRAVSAIAEIMSRVTNVFLWIAGLWGQNVPKELKKETLTIPLRCAPAVLREVEPALGFYTDVDSYSNTGVPSPGDGLNSIRLCHHGTDHRDRWPVDCEKCGHDVAEELRRLGVGDKDGSIQNSDVFILTRSMELQDEFKDENGHVLAPASGVVRGIRASGLQVGVLGSRLRIKDFARWEKEAEDMRLSSSNKITVAHWNDVQGTERKVVVWLKCQTQDDEDRQVADLNDRLHIVSRCTTQLIVVDVPPYSIVTAPTLATAPATTE